MSNFKKYEATHKIRFSEEELLDLEQAWEKKNLKNKSDTRKKRTRQKRRYTQKNGG